MKIQAILKEMPLKDKIALCSGASFWQTKAMEKYNIPSLFMCDGPHGLRKQEKQGDMLGINKALPATCFPTAVTTGMSWDEDLLTQIGRAIGEEAAEKGVGLVLGPGANLKRDPRCGRNFEYFSEDPYLTGKMAGAFLRGLQENGTKGSLKHFACNSQEKSRFISDSLLDERTLRELYLTGFEIAVKEGKPGTVMCAYNKINGTHCSDSKALLTDILREEWGFEGLVVTDWGAMHNRTAAFLAGCDLNMPGGSAYGEKEALRAVEQGLLPEEAVDRCARRVLELVLGAKKQKAGTFNPELHHQLAREAAAKGAVLLKNEEDILPLKKGETIALFGDMAKNPRYQGAGSSHINPTRLVSALEAMGDCLYAQGCDSAGDTTEGMLDQAVKIATEVSVAVVFAGLPASYESEGFDRDSLELPQGHTRLIEAVALANPNTVVVLTGGGVMTCPWADKVKAILYLGLPGQAGGQAAADLLYGAVNPSGKLTESWPYTYGDCQTSQSYGTTDALYTEGVYVGYRYYDTAGKAVRWPFGYGLSYTSFAYSDMAVDGDLVTATVTNTGTREGSEIAQLYVAAHTPGLHRPKRELKGFQKVCLKPGESKKVTFTLTDRSFALWQDGWKIPAGSYTLEIGPSSRELPLAVTVQKDGQAVPAPQWQPCSWYEKPEGTPTREDFEKLLGRAYAPIVPQKGSFTLDNTPEEMMKQSLFMKLFYKAVSFFITLGSGGDKNSPECRMMLSSSVGGPMRGMQINAGMKGGLFAFLVKIANRL